MSKKAIIGSIIILLLIIAQGFGIYWAVKTKKITYKADIDQFPGTFSLSPTIGSHQVGEDFNIQVKIDAKGDQVQGAQIILHYDPQILKVQDSLTDVSGTQIKPEALFPNYINNYIDEQAGTITLAGYIVPPEDPITISGEQLFATVTFNALKESSGTNVSFEYTRNDPNKTGIAEAVSNADILASVTNGNYIIIAAGGVTPPPVSCGDGTCNGSETSTTCPADCKSGSTGGTGGTTGTGTGTGTSTGTTTGTGTGTTSSATTGPRIPLSTMVIIGLLLALNVAIFIVGRKVIKKA
jgi:hypothetical protein